MTARTTRGRSASCASWLRWAGFVLCTLLWLPTPSAQALDALSLLREHLRPLGGSATMLRRDFLFEGQALVETVRVERAGCWAVLAWGGTGLRDVDLGIYSPAGQLLSEDRGSTPFSYARLCSAAGGSVYVSAQAYAGRGELTLFLIERAPRSLGRLPEALPLAVSQGGRASAPRAVGGEQVETTVESTLLYEERAMAAAGYTALGPANVLDLRAGVAQGTLLLPGSSCLRLVAFAPAARGMMLEVEGALVRRETRSPDAELLRLALCTGSEGLHVVRVRTRAMRAAVLIRLFEHPLATPADASRYGEERALLLAEARSQASERGLTLQHVGEAWLEGGSSLIWPLPTAEPECQMIIALPERGVEAELRLLDEQGVVLASNEGRRAPTSVFACGAEQAKLRLLLRGRGSPGPVSVWLARGGRS